ncbi:MAG: hypothetical protein WCP08_02600 [Prolixibacteraceae bacterium]
MQKLVVLLLMIAPSLWSTGKNPDKPIGTRIRAISELNNYPDKRPAVRFRLDAKDSGVVLKHGAGTDSCDYLGMRDVWVWEYKGTYYMHYDGAGLKGWLACLAVSSDLIKWETRGPALDFGVSSQKDCASASYGTTFFDGEKWHLFYLGTPNVTKKPDFIPAFPYLTMKAESNSPKGPWVKRYDITPFEPKKGTYYDATTSPGHIIKTDKEFLMFFSASTGSPKIMRTISLARTNNLDGAWTIDAKPMLPPEEQIENTSLYFEESSKTWFLFTNHVGLKDKLEYTDAIWVYWSKDLYNWDPANKAVVLDSSCSKWSRHIIGLPSVVKSGNRLAVFYDGNDEVVLPQGVKSHMNRDVGLAWIDLPIVLPIK